MSSANMYLWWGSGSIPCWKPMIVLAEKGLWKGCPNKLVEFSKKDQKGEDVMKLNPRGQVPTFRDGDIVVNESDAICMYLDDTYSNNRLIPTDTAARALCYQKMFESSNIRSNIQIPLVYYKTRTQKENWDDVHITDGMVKAKEELKLWEAFLTGKEYLVGGQFSMADVFFYPLLAMVVRQGGQLTKFPALRKYYDGLSERPCIKETTPPHWAITPSPDHLEGL